MTQSPNGSDPKTAGAQPGGHLSLSQLLPTERIALDVKVSTWQEAVRAAGRLLHDTGVVTVEYIEAMVKVAEELGPYIAIAPGIALPHASTEAGARQTGLSFVRLAAPVNFGNPDNDPVRVLFALAAVDKDAHMLALKALAELFLSKDLMAKLAAARDKRAVIGILREAEKMAEN
jgi:PTS system ascorbate-specific IIA component